MNLKSIIVLALVVALALSVRADERYDVVVYGGTPGGIVTAIAAAREGAAAVVIEPTKHIGGMVAGGLSHTDSGNPAVIGGIAHEFFARADAKYNDPDKTKHSRNFWFSEPHVAEQVFHEMLREAGVKLVTGQKLKSVTRHAPHVTSIAMTDGTVYRGKMFVDATYEGDLMARAGVKYIVGREGRADYGELQAGFYPAPLRPRTVELMAKPGSTYTHGTPTNLPARDASGKLLWGVTDKPWPAPGTGDRLVQCYNFRVIATPRKDNQVPFPKPKNYDPTHYELLLQLVLKYPGIRFEKLVHTGAVPNDKYDLNASGLIFGTDYWGANTDYPDGDDATRARIWQDHVDYVQGFFWFLGHDERVPQELRDQVNAWGLAKDEFTDNNHWPYALYVREARRMLGAYVMRQQDCQTDITKPDAIAMGSFILDSHALQRLVTPDGNVIDEGNFDGPTKPYQIPYRSITPKPEQCRNLLVPVCMSATHVAYGSIRMEPQYMAMGHAAGLAAVMALRADKAVQDIDVPALQVKLHEQEQVLALVRPSSKLPGIVMDAEDARLTGNWISSNFGGGSYRHDHNEEKGKKSARFELKVPADGRYEVRFLYTAYANRATNVPITVESADGLKTIQMNQRKPSPVSLGIYRFTAAKPAVVTVSNEGTDGYVVIEVVQLLPVTP